MSRFWKIALLILTAVVVVMVGSRVLHGGWHHGADMGAETDNTPVPVTVVAATRQAVPIYATATGTVTALSTVTVNPQVGGQLLSLNFREGQEVKKGDLLAQIDPRSLQASYDQAAASKRQNQALLATARSTFQRSDTPAYRQYVAKTDLDTQRNQVAQYEAAVAANDAQMRAAQVQLQYTRILAPNDGLTGLRGVDVGNIVTTSSNIVTITQIHPIYVTFNLPERQLQEVRQAQAAGPLSIAALDRTDAHVITGDGHVDVIDNQINADTGTFKVRAQFPNTDRNLWPGQFVNVRLTLRTIPDAVVVPTQAVQRGPNGDYVYVVQGDNKVKMQTVLQGADVGDTQVQLVQGLKAGERVVTEGQFRLKPGTKVNALKPGEAPPAPTEAELKAAEEKQKRREANGGGHRGGPH
ncbi:efflux RND transporter periplasmic adaptor subunit [Xanthomonas albilineans]|uniref:Probable membrane fusion protein n=1 Tax=Xanthomonas albilineans (strain GPE PC73 / CFBP 7063) TaxID=380358 RepID=D2UFP9_XANAP|nr:efflux RND transporter periplasmic adaptor subunit [Xanthomonas albilineans]QHQ29460.1 putative membrane fusion protein [Xanthomonas albilineans]CBA17210.1 probable membrane fusion protein [Xanthomonas albilineans GPE PC73]